MSDIQKIFTYRGVQVDASSFNTGGNIDKNEVQKNAEWLTKRYFNHCVTESLAGDYPELKPNWWNDGLDSLKIGNLKGIKSEISGGLTEMMQTPIITCVRLCKKPSLRTLTR